VNLSFFPNGLIDLAVLLFPASTKSGNNTITDYILVLNIWYNADQVQIIIGLKDMRHRYNRLFTSPLRYLHASCPNHKGDWYFTGNYPTPGGNKVANRSFINYMQGKNVAYLDTSLRWRALRQKQSPGNLGCT